MVAGGIMIPFLGLAAVIGPNMASNNFEAQGIVLKRACTEAFEVLEREIINLDDASVDLQPRFGGAEISSFAYSLSDVEAGLECQADLRRGQGNVTHIIIDGEDRTKDLRLKEQN